MKSMTKRSLLASVVLLGQLSLAATPATANPAIMLGDTICDNQADVFDYDWITANVANTRLFFVSGNSVNTGVITPIGHTDAFDNSADVNIALHGDVNVVSNFSGTDFAAVFLANHASTPTTVTMYVCESGTPSPNTLSSMAAVARSYPGQAQDSTAITTVTAPGPNTCPQLRSSATAPVTPINAIAAATYSTGVSHTNGYGAALATLTNAWDSQQTLYPNTQQTYEDYCTAQLALDPTGAAWVAGFITNVVTQFSVDYLALINTNYDGNALATCGTNVQCD